MGIGGVLLSGFSKQTLKEVEKKRFDHNRQVLEEAKQALLMYAYNYPNIALGFSPPTIRGPGRLPCPDDDSSGTPNNPCTGAGPLAVGRFPIIAPGMQFYEAMDSSGESLWYAVSRTFQNQVTRVNSDSLGTITVFDQSGGLQYAGATNGVAAIIIAPGAPIKRDENNDGIYEYQQVRGTSTQRDNPQNYLDTFGSFDNSDYINDSNTASDGFIQGPVFNNNTLVVNDQFIIITAEEVIAMAEKATLEAYKDAINAYLDNTGGVYPWLYNYNVATAPGLQDEYRALAGAEFTTLVTGERVLYLDNTGRIPSIFGRYFTEVDSNRIESQINIDLTIPYDGAIVLDPIIGVNATEQFVAGANHNFNIQTAEPLTGLRFEDNPTDPLGGADIDLVGTLAAAESFNAATIFFWDDKSTPNGFWTVCGDDGDVVTDCNRDAGGVNIPGLVPGVKESIILKVDAVLDLAAGVDAVNMTLDVSSLPGIPANPTIDAATNTSHAMITASFINGEMSLLPVTINYQFDDEYTDSGDWDVNQNGTIDLAGFANTTLSVGLRYYPELPGWAYDNNWHNSVMMAYAVNYIPDNPLFSPPCSEGVTCIQIEGMGGNNDNKISILTIAGQHDWNGDGDDDYINDLPTIFDTKNEDLDNIYDARGGNDTILVLE